MLGVPVGCVYGYTGIYILLRLATSDCLCLFMSWKCQNFHKNQDHTVFKDISMNNVKFDATLWFWQISSLCSTFKERSLFDNVFWELILVNYTTQALLLQNRVNTSTHKKNNHSKKFMLYMIKQKYIKTFLLLQWKVLSKPCKENNGVHVSQTTHQAITKRKKRKPCPLNTN